MNNVIKATKLDFALLKPYIKSICVVLLVPIGFTIMTRTLISGVTFAMCVMSMSSSYTFAVSEKNGMERLYDILPIEKKNLVLGKYLCVCSLGLLALVVSLILQPLVLFALSVPTGMSEVLVAGVTGVVMFLVYVAFQVPGYYKYGSIKGRMFMYVPIAGFLLVYLLVINKSVMQSQALAVLFSSPAAAAALILLLSALLLFVSVIDSIKILQKKEY